MQVWVFFFFLKKKKKTLWAQTHLCSHAPVTLGLQETCLNIPSPPDATHSLTVSPSHTLLLFQENKISAPRNKTLLFLLFTFFPNLTSLLFTNSMDEFIPKEETRKNSMEEFISKERKRKYQGIPKKVTKKHSHLCAAEAANLLPPRRTRSSLNDARLLPRRSYDIYFCVPFRADGEELKLHKKENHETAWAYWRWYNVSIHPDGPGEGNQKQLLPFWKGKLPLFGGIAALHSRIYFFGGVTCGPGFIRDVYKLDLDAASKVWVPVSPMGSRRFEPSASVLGGKIYVRNYQPFDHSGDLWCEAFDPVNDKWKPFPSPPIYPGSSSIVLSEALENPDRILVAYRAPMMPLLPSSTRITCSTDHGKCLRLASASSTLCGMMSG
jgi:hypothetical protein